MSGLDAQPHEIAALDQVMAEIEQEERGSDDDA